MPTGENCRRQRATSPSEQSSRIWSWISTTAPAAATTLSIAIRAAASPPTTTIPHVIAFGVTRVGRSARVRWIERRRTYSLPAQCSPLLRAKIEAGWATARSSAIDGRDEGADTAPHLLLVERQVLEDRVAVGPRVGSGHDRRGELLLGEPEVRRRARQPVAAEAVAQGGEHRVVAAQVG